MSYKDFVFYEWLINEKRMTAEEFAYLTMIDMRGIEKEFALYCHGLQ